MVENFNNRRWYNLYYIKKPQAGRLTYFLPFFREEREAKAIFTECGYWLSIIQIYYTTILNTRY